MARSHDEEGIRAVRGGGTPHRAGGVREAGAGGATARGESEGNALEEGETLGAGDVRAVRGGGRPTGGVRVVVSCEHAGRRIPARHRRLFRGAEAALASHRGWDPGALGLARRFAHAFGAPLRYSLTTRLLVDPNRSEDSETLFSEWTASLPEAERRAILARHHRRYRAGVTRTVTHLLDAGAHPLLHLSVHTFTPLWEGKERSVDVGILFDPARSREARLAEAWIRALRRTFPAMRIRANAPYRGTDDGLVTKLRGELPTDRYLGIELEVNQREATRLRARRKALAEGLVTALAEALDESPTAPLPPGRATPKTRPERPNPRDAGKASRGFEGPGRPQGRRPRAP